MIKKALKRKSEKSKKVPTRITNDTVAEHREKILAGGRKHKYPIQYTRHRLVWNAIFIGLGTAILMTVFVWVQLYIWRDTGDVAYRITRTIPLPVASIEGATVRYSDYLRYYRSTLASLESVNRLGGDDKVKFQRQQSMDLVVKITYAKKIAQEKGITVSDFEIDAALQRHKRGLSDASYDAAVRKTLGLSLAEMKENLRDSLITSKVSFAVDDKATNLVSAIDGAIKSGKSLADIATEHGQSVQYVADMSVGKDNADGITEQALKIEPGTTSEAKQTVSGDGYYFIRVDERTDSSVKYSYIHVPLTVFKAKVDAFKTEKKATYYISLD